MNDNLNNNNNETSNNFFNPNTAPNNNVNNGYVNPTPDLNNNVNNGYVNPTPDLNNNVNNGYVNPTPDLNNNVNNGYVNPTPDLNNNINNGYVNPTPDLNNNVNNGYVNPTPDLNNSVNNGYVNPMPDLNNNVNYTASSKKNINIDIKKYLKYGGTALGVIGVIVVSYFIFTNLFGSGGHKNTTGLSSYTDSEVGLNCHEKRNNSDNTTDVYFDFVFNKDNQTYAYMKIVKIFPDGLTDQKYADLVKEYDTYDDLKCGSYNSKCLENHHEFPMSQGAFDIIIDRNGNNLEMTSYFVIGAGQKVTNKDIKETKAEYEKLGYTCN